MPIDVSWHTPNAVIKARLYGQLDIEQFHQLDKEILEHIAQSDRSLVHLWVDLMDADNFPANVAKVNSAFTHKHNPQLGWTVLITDNRLIKFVGYMVTQISQARFRPFDTRAEAEKFLFSMDQDLANQTLHEKPEGIPKETS